jgi:hypothetical protein
MIKDWIVHNLHFCGFDVNWQHSLLISIASVIFIIGGYENRLPLLMFFGFLLLILGIVLLIITRKKPVYLTKGR